MAWYLIKQRDKFTYTWRPKFANVTTPSYSVVAEKFVCVCVCVDETTCYYTRKANLVWKSATSRLGGGAVRIFSGCLATNFVIFSLITWWVV
jgi:hypothetical protein